MRHSHDTSYERRRDAANGGWNIRSLASWLGAGLACALVLAGCGRTTPVETDTEPEPDTRPPLSGDVTSLYDAQTGGDQVFMIDMSAVPADTFEYALDLRGVADAVQVYLISTNTSVDDVDAPQIDMTVGQTAAVPQERPSPAEVGGAAIRRDRTEVTEFNNNPPLGALRGAAGRSRSPSRAALRPSQVGDTNVFQDRDWVTDSPYDIPATVRAAVSAGGQPYRLAVWVADESWSDAASTCDLVHCVTQPMVDAIADKFLQAGADNDIYDWLTAVFGAPWGAHDIQGLISPDTDELHILLFDIDGDESTRGGVIGFFYGGDALLRDPDFPGFITNEKLMFYLDSVLLATPDDPEATTWNPSDFWASVVISTLAHEFQHMIHFYQKLVRYRFETTSQVWLNEMSSEVAEDLVANKLGVPGPRGVAHTDGSAGERFNGRGRLPLYNTFNDIQVTRWDGWGYNYSINYALGAYLARTYGAPLFTDIVQSDRSGTEAIEAAIMVQTGTSTTFGQVLANWAVANVLSDDPDAPAPYRYNAGDWISSTAGGVTFDLGSIDLYRYEYIQRLEGPFFHSVAQLGRRHQQPPHSNVYVDLGRHDGVMEAAIRTSPGTQITLVVRD